MALVVRQDRCDALPCPTPAPMCSSDRGPRSSRLTPGRYNPSLVVSAPLTKTGFLSAVQDRADSDIIVRAPVRADIQANGWPYEETPDADYAFRARVKREVWADFVADAAMAVDYDNYKNTVPEDDDARHEAYMESDGAAGAPAARLGQVSPRVAWVVAHIDLPEQTERLPKPNLARLAVNGGPPLPPPARILSSGLPPHRGL